MMREKLRINGKLINCETGDRIVTCKTSSLKEPLARFMSFAQFTGKVYHPGQDINKKTVKCSKCLEEGHSFKFCENDWKCTKCFSFGHKQDSCWEDNNPMDASLSATIPTQAEIVDTTPNAPIVNDIPQTTRDNTDDVRKTPRKHKAGKKNQSTIHWDVHE